MVKVGEIVDGALRHLSVSPIDQAADASEVNVVLDEYNDLMFELASSDGFALMTPEQEAYETHATQGRADDFPLPPEHRGGFSAMVALRAAGRLDKSVSADTETRASKGYGLLSGRFGTRSKRSSGILRRFRFYYD